MSQQQFQFVIVGRLVSGSVSEPRTTDYDGNPRKYKDGHEKAGQPYATYDFGVAVPKLGESHWSQRPDFGQGLHAFGVQCWPQGQTQRPDFAWKIIDGDSQVPNKKGKKPCEKEGYPGHWVLMLSSSRAPDLYRLEQGRPVVETDPRAIKAGYWVQAEVRAASNSTPSNAGLFLNHGVVCLVGIDKEIIQRTDPVKLGIGQNIVLPPGVSMTNFAAVATPSLPTQQPVPPLPFVAAPTVPVTTPSPMMTSPSSPPQIPVTPRPSFLTPGAPAEMPSFGNGVPLPPAAPLPPPPASVGPQLTAKANGATYAQLIAGGWTDALLRQEGLLV